jgi:thioredoxin reductase
VIERRVVVVGAGPAGLSAAIELGRQGVTDVLVVEREAEPGGIPRHSAHQGFGLRDLHRSYSGPRYAAELARRAIDAGAELACSTTVTSLEADDGPRLELTSPSGRQTIEATAVLVATGARERPRAARLIPGDRPSGIFTTGALQQWVEAGLPVGRRAVVLGAEHVSYSAVLTLRHAGVRTVALVTEQPHQQSVRGAGLAARALGVRTLCHHRVVGLQGRERLHSVVVEDVRTAARTELMADTFVASGDWIPDHDLVRRSGLGLDPSTLGPRSDAWGRTGRAGLFAAGNLVHPVETADRCALGGRRAARALADALDGRPGGRLLGVESAEPLRWAWPNLVDPAAPPARLVLRTERFARRAEVVAVEAGRVLGRARLHGGVPHQHSWVDGSILAGATEGPVRLELA